MSKIKNQGNIEEIQILLKKLNLTDKIKIKEDPDTDKIKKSCKKLIY